MSSRRFDTLRRHILDTCTACGQCVRICPSVNIAGLDHLSPAKIQKHLLDFIADPQQDAVVSKRIDSCLECFKCVESCPEHLNPLTCIEIAKSLSFQQGYEPYIHAVPSDVSSHEQAIATHLTPHERRAVLTGSASRKTSYVFFPGCNIYNNPTRLRKVQEMLSLISDDIAFIPGLQFCCGDKYLFDGRFDEAEEQYTRLAEEIQKYQPATVILWCPTCLTRIKTMWKSDFQHVSFFQFCQQHLEHLPFSDSGVHETVTLHEPCKTAYTALDTSHRDLIQALPNVTLTEMPSGIRCCGSGGIAYYHEATVNTITRTRLEEAVNTGAETLVTVCHYCQDVFETENTDERLNIVNLADLMYRKLQHPQRRPLGGRTAHQVSHRMC